LKLPPTETAERNQRSALQIIWTVDSWVDRKIATAVRVGSEHEMVKGVYSTWVGWCTSYNYGLKGVILIIHHWQLLGSFAVRIIRSIDSQSSTDFERVNVT
jgi:hypothetical protein